MNLENYFFSHRGRSVKASEVWVLVEGDDSGFRAACGIARGNNVRIITDFKPMIDMAPILEESKEIREITRRR